MSSCAICRRAAPDGHHACQRHAAELRGWLHELPHQTRLLRDFLQPSASPPAGRIGGTGRATAPIPVDLRVLTLLGPGHPDPPAGPFAGEDGDDTIPVLAFLDAWAGSITYAYPAAYRDPYGTAHTRPCEQAWPTHGATITGWCTWLLAYLPFTLTLPLVAELHRQTGDLLARIRNLTHAVPRRHPKAAPCPKCKAFDLAAIDGKWGITCQACGHHLEPDAYDQHRADFLADHQQLNTA